jgi:zinc D-Ala-D-Ala carboxypeptidase
MRLSNHFTLEEFCRSNTATRMGKPIVPEPHIVDNLEFLVYEVLQPIRDLIDVPMIITSGYRPPWLNKKIGGSKTSQHMQGLAADFVLSSHADITLLEACQKIVQQNGDDRIFYDQLIYEFGEWIHVSAAPNPREQVLSALKQRKLVGKPKTVYRQGLHHGYFS